MREDARNFSNRKKSNGSKRDEENAQLEKERKSDRLSDNAEHEVLAREVDTPDIDEPVESEQSEQTELTEHSKEYETLMKQIKSLGIKYNARGRKAELHAIVKNHFGAGRKITEAKESDLPNMRYAYEEMDRYAQTWGII